jgi:hypothetical protein
MSRWDILITGSNDAGFDISDPSTVQMELPYMGIFWQPEADTATKKALNGDIISQRRYRDTLTIELLPASTWNYDTFSTNDLYTLKTILSKLYLKLELDASSKSANRWGGDIGNAWQTAELFPFIVGEADLSISTDWTAGIEKATLSVTNAQL